MPLLPRFTDAGKALQLRALDGEEIRFTKIQMGSGTLGETSYKTFNALLEPKVTIPITDISVSNGYAAIRGYFNNEKLNEGFYYRELGLFAKDPDDDTKEILYCYGNTGEQASFIAEPGSVLIERSIKIIAVVDDAEKISAVINGSAVYVDFTDMKRAIEEHNADSNAHADMRNQSLTYYIDCTSTEDDEVCDGSYEHPFKNISDVEYAYPNYIRSLRVVFLKAGDYVLNQDMYFGYADLESLEITYNGSATNKPIIHGSIMFGAIKNIYISNVSFACEGRSWTSTPSKLWFESCNSVWLSNVIAQCNTTDGCGFVDSFSSNIYLTGCSVSNMNYAVGAWSTSTVHITDCTINTVGNSFQCDESTIYNYDVTDVTYAWESGIIFTPEIMEKITDGTLIDHINSTANPHHVSLDQAQQEGGMIDVPHGGTGQKTFTAGALLKGNGTGAVGMVSGTGAVYATTSGDPKFGTLPVSMGGTGKTSFTSGSVVIASDSGFSGKVGEGVLWAGASGHPTFGTLPVRYGGTGLSEHPASNALIVGGGLNNPLKTIAPANGALYQNGSTLAFGILPVMFGGTGSNALKSYIASNAVDGARHGHLVLAFGSGPKILVCWGRISPDIGEGVTVNFSTRCGNYFKDNVYTLIFSGNDIENGKITKNNTNFVIDSAVVARAADWIAIGEVHD